MTCPSCGKANLPDGVRCVYCGASFGPVPDFELDLPGTETAARPPGGTAEAAPPTPQRPVPAGLLGALALLLLKGKSLLALLKAGPILTTLGTMGVFIAAESRMFGWKLALGFAVCIFIHEMGHVVMNWRHGLKCSAPMFIPFLGAVITLKQFPEDPTVESESGAGGPAAGLLAALACSGLAAWTGDRYWLALAFLGYVVNLFNLIPFGPLDGARITTALGPANWDFVLIGLLLVVLKAPSTAVWLLLVVLFLMRLGRTAHGRHNLATPLTRARMALVMLGLVLALGYGADRTHQAADLISPPATAAAPREPSRSAEAEKVGERPGPGNGPEQPARPAELPPLPLRQLAAGQVFVLGLVLLVWLLAASLLARASGQPSGRRGWAFAGGMLLPLVALYALQWLHRVDPGLGIPRLGTLNGAYFAALFTALVFAIYHRTHADPRSGYRPRPALTWRCLAWAAGGALAVGYWADDWRVAGMVLLSTAVFYACRPWLLLSLIARGWEALGALDRAIRWRRRALALRPDAEAAPEMWHSVARWHVALRQGEAALQALDAAEAPPGETLAGLLATSTRAGALVLTDRFAEALQTCETLLRAPAGDRLGPWRLLLVRGVLAELALYRGWPDEAAAQAGVALRSIPRTASGIARALAAEAHCARATAYVSEGQLAEGRAECEQALRWGRDAVTDVTAMLLRAQACLRAGDPEGADRETEAALRRLPESLEARYWRGCALRERGRGEEAEALLRQLAGDYPGEHWGRQAQAALSGL